MFTRKKSRRVFTEENQLLFHPNHDFSLFGGVQPLFRLQNAEARLPGTSSKNFHPPRSPKCGKSHFCQKVRLGRLRAKNT